MGGCRVADETAVGCRVAGGCQMADETASGFRTVDCLGGSHFANWMQGWIAGALALFAEDPRQLAAQRAQATLDL